ncbi:T9SS type A sorting domain-containing protein [Paenimyroides viscosum]|uniref:T9SS C-terminal target domain-containing protein n=1 Tax=Paenimyroides viscosum TaxID=2488729 RepID=A0A3P1B0H8_9FLAO|nr:T9SS type A sorting domain-containing protein [Paenimyroides viscosum]RRA94577.1 T9SS C-terminal target domain-containing protein [Paenimyroides viscosum]
MKKKFTIYLFLLFVIPTVKAQVLFNEDFNSYSAGHLINDYTSTTPQQGGWYSGTTPPVTASAMVTPETGKGNVLVITSNGTLSFGAVSFRQAQGVIDALWNNRTAGNNILKVEYEFYGTDNFIGNCGITSQGSTLINVVFNSVFKRIVCNYWYATSHRELILKNYNTDPFPYNMWIKAEMFVDYNTKNVYFYIPTLNFQKADNFSHSRLPEGLSFGVSSLNLSSVVKFDNIKITALQTLPSYILSSNEQLAAKFNLYPNPATKVVNITNSENMLVQQVTVYDVSGKLITTQNFNEQAEIQLNVESLASGTYMLHLQTNEGTAVKKLVKK